MDVQIKKERRKELREFYQNDDQKDQEIVECEINNFQRIRLNFLGKVRDSAQEFVNWFEREVVMNVKED